MVLSTAIMIGGAIAGGVGGSIANKKRIEDQQDELDILALKSKQNYAEQRAAVIGLKNSLENQSIQATQGARRDAVEAFQATSGAEAAAGSSGIRGGTPFYKMGQVAAEAAQTIKENAAMRANQIEATRANGEAEIAGVKTNGSILDKQNESAQKSMGYLNSFLGWSQSILTGSVSGAEMGAKLSMGLESIGVDTGFDLGNLIPKPKVPAKVADAAIGASGMGAAGVTDAMMGGAKSTIAEAAAGDGNLDDYIAKYREKPNPTYSGLALSSLFSSGKGKETDFNDIMTRGIKNLSTTQVIDEYGLLSLKKNPVPLDFNAFGGISLE